MSIAESPTRDLSQELQDLTSAVRLQKTFLGITKTLTPDQKARAGGSFGADGSFLSASKKLINTRNPRYREITKVMGDVSDYWKSVTVPFPERGTRLIRTDAIQALEDQARRYRIYLDAATLAFQTDYDTIKEEARQHLGELHDFRDYPDSVQGLFTFTFDYPSVLPDERLRLLHPGVFDREMGRIRSKFDEALRLTTEGFTEEFAKAVSHLADKLKSGKRFYDTDINHLHDFIDKFRRLNVGGNEDLEALVGQAKQVVSGATPRGFRNSPELRTRVQAEMTTMQGHIEELMHERPRRSITLDDE